MRPTEVEQWAIRILDRLDRSVLVEDDRVEMKRQLPDDIGRVTRRIAGHANQARSDRILWLIGVDEAEQRVVGLDEQPQDLADWWASIESKFDGPAPGLTHAHIDTDDGTVLAMGFETDRLPYVIRVPDDGANREVPWREGTRVRSANRTDLLKVLVPVLSRPTLTVISPGHIEYRYKSEPDSFDPDSGRPLDLPESLAWRGIITVYLEVDPSAIVPDHLCSGQLSIDGWEHVVNLSCQLEPPWMYPRSSEPAGRLARRGDGQLVADGPSLLIVQMDGEIPTPPPSDAPPAESAGELKLQFQTASASSQPFSLELVARPADLVDANAPRGRWILEAPI